MNRYFFILILWAVLLLTFSCGTKTETLDEPVLAQVGDRVITVNDFIRRSEYTIRPEWCRGETNVHKMIVLNSLIAEKLLAIEAADAAEILQKQEIRNYLRGRKEQEMRQLYFQKMAMDKVSLNEMELNNSLLLAERTYDTQFIAINSDSLADLITEDLKNGILSYEQILSELSERGMEFPVKKVTFETSVDDVIHKSLFQNPVTKGQVIGPLRVDKNRNVLIKVNGWIHSPVISTVKAEQLRHDVVTKMREIKGRDIYAGHIKSLMSGKRLEFNEKTFKALVNSVGPLYFRPAAERHKSLKNRFWNIEDSTALSIDDVSGRVDDILDEPLFTIDGTSWTVKDFETELQSHPLVFRRQKFSKAEFAEQFQLAIADLIRDHYISKAAYEMDLDKDPRVQQKTQTWQDNLSALYEREQLLKDKNVKDLSGYEVVTKYLDSYFDNLSKKYSDQISINVEAFDKIQLTKIDVLALQENVPFPVYVPQFPQLTTFNSLDYGQKMKKEN